MPVCPACKKDFARRKNGGCPYCGEELQEYNGYLYAASLGSPAQALLTIFEKHVSAQASRAQGFPVVFHVSKKSSLYKREMVEAQRLLDLCEGDFDLAKEALNILFSNQQFSFKTRSTLIGISRDFSLAKVIAEAIRAELARKEAQQSAAIDAIMERNASIWS